ncbi:Homeobox-leucine zipper protein ATHB-15 [Glycine max]|nr:Homeobox-leucine zipper protein ATHB-15 [Glycine max]
MSCKDGSRNGIGIGMDNGKYVRYTPEQVEALERLYHDCPKPSSIRRLQLIRECPTLSHIDPKQIKVWFQNRRCREKQRKESSRLQAVNRKLTAMNKLLMEEIDRLQKQVSQLVYENGYFRQHTTQNTKQQAIKDTSCESAVRSGQQHNLTTQHPPRDASPAGLLSIAEETLEEFLSKATGTAVEWVQMPGMKPGPDSIGIVAISHGCNGVAARACGLVGLEPTRVAEILKDRPLWFRDCRAVDVLNVLPTANGGTIELLYMQLYAPTTLAPARDFWLLRYTSVLEDSSLVICERSLKNTQNGPSMPPVQHFVRAEMLPSGYLIRPCEGGGSIIHIVDHMNLEPWSVPEVLRPLYESSKVLSQKTTMAALRHLRQISHEVSPSNVSGWGRRPSALRALSQRLSRGFNEALNGFTDEGWTTIGNDGVDDVTILVNSSPDKLMGLNLSFANGFPSVSNAVLCAKASMLLQNVHPAILLRFLREHRSEWADNNMDAYTAAAIKVGPCSFSGSRVGNYGGQVILPLAHTIEHEEFLEVIKLEGVAHSPDDTIMPREMFLLQLCSGMDENAVGTCAELISAPIDASFADDAPLLPSGFRIIPLESGKEASSPNRTLDLASSLDVGPSGNRASDECAGNSSYMRSVMTIAFEFAFESHMQEHVAAMARQYVRSIISSVQRVGLALSPSHLSSHAGLRSPLGTPEAQTLAHWICNSYRCYLGVELLKSNNEGNESLLKSLWHHSDAILCCTLKALPVFTFSNQAGLDMLETTLVALQDIPLEKIFDDHERKILFSEFPQIIQQGFACLQGGICLSSMGRPVSYERVVAWKVLNEEENAHCICFICREKQRKESSRLQAVNRKLTAMNKLLMEENDRLQKQVSQLVYENGYFRQHTQITTQATKDTNCESVVTSGQHNLTTQHPPRDASPAGLLSIAEETLAEFLSKATGTAVEWVQMPGMKPGPDSIGIVAISHGCTGVAARACGLVGLEPTRVAEILKDRPLWFRDCRAVDVLNVLPTANGGTIELLYMQLYAPTTLAPARDFWLLRYTSVLEDGSLVICERSLKNTQNGPSMPPVQHFVRAEMLPSGYLIRPCEGGGSIIHIVDHMDLEPWSVPEVLRPLYESSTVLAQKTTMAALRHLRQISHEVSQSNVTGWGRRPAALRALSQRLSRGFNEALNGFTDEGWTTISNDGVDDVTILVNSSPDKLMGLNLSFANGFPSVSNAVLCAKASMLLQNVPPAILLRFLREHRSEWADNNMDAYTAAAIKVGPCSLSGSCVGNFGGQVILPLAHTIEHEEFLEVIKLEGIAHSPEDTIMPREMFLLQLCSGMDENAVGTCAELISAPIDASFADDAPLLPSGFRIIPLESGKEASSPNRTLDLASSLDVGPSGNRASNGSAGNSSCMRSVMTIAFEFAFESHMQEHVTSMARQYVRSIISSVQRVALALSPSHLSSHAGLRSPLGTPEAQTLAHWICNSYRCYLGVELLKSNNEGNESLLKSLWHHSDAILCCTLKALPVFTFSNQAGLDMLETTLVALQDITLEKIFDDHGRKILFSEFPQIIQQGFACLQGGICLSSMGRPVSYERVVAWKVLNEEENAHCICFMFVNWSFV